MGFWNTTDIGIDLGTSSILVYRKNEGIVLSEPSLVAVERRTGKLTAIGETARAMLGRTPPEIAVVRPLQNGVISDFEATRRLLGYFFKKVAGARPLIGPRVVLCIPSGVTEAEKRCVVEAATAAGARRCYLIEEPIAAAIGAGIDIAAGRGSMVLDIGGGTTDMAVISFGGIVLSDSIRVAGDRFDEALIRYIRRKHDLVIGERSAEDIKIQYGRAHIGKEQQIIEIRGRSLLTGLPESVPVGTNELVDAMAEPLRQIMDRVRTLFEQTPPELAADITESGVCLTGGGAQLAGLDRYIADYTGVPCRLADNPVTCVAMGTGRVIENLSVYSGALRDYRRREYR